MCNHIMGYIYMLTSPNGKTYIGQTLRPVEERLKEHLKKGSHCVVIYNAIQKYGWENFEKDWYEVPNEDLSKHEELMIEVLGTLSPDGYNIKEGGANGKLSEETKQKIRKSAQGETYNSKKVYQYDLEGNLLGSFDSSGEAGRHIGKDGRNIRLCAAGGRPTAYGFKWSNSKM
jgi:hypothetical protein